MKIRINTKQAKKRSNPTYLAVLVPDCYQTAWTSDVGAVTGGEDFQYCHLAEKEKEHRAEHYDTLGQTWVYLHTIIRKKKFKRMFFFSFLA